jgi:hypothetical protein
MPILSQIAAVSAGCALPPKIVSSSYKAMRIPPYERGTRN